VRYRSGLKRTMEREFLGLVDERLPYCGVRYAF
jgi:hypothetical protein